MGTNYYLYETKACECCGRQDAPRHIGKSSAGWAFSLRIYPDDGICDLGDWKVYIRDLDGEIKDEYDRVVSSEKLFSIITDRKGNLSNVPYGFDSWAEFNQANSSWLDTNNGLLRSIPDGRRTIANAEGTYDLCVGDFS